MTERPQPQTPALLAVDFDGTITEEDMLERMLRHFGDPEVNRRVDEAFAAGELSLMDEIGCKLAAVQAPLDDVVAWLRLETRIRPGWAELVRGRRAAGGRVAVVTSSFVELVGPLLGDTRGDVELLANTLEPDPSGWRTRVAAPELCPECGESCKRALLGRLDADELVYVGDGYSDRCASQVAHRVFARDDLARYLGERGFEFEPFGDFHDVASALEQERAAA